VISVGDGGLDLKICAKYGADSYK